MIMLINHDIHLLDNKDQSKVNQNDLRSTNADFVTKFPSEVLSNIFVRLSLEDLTAIKGVSQQYKDRVIACPKAWTRIVLSQNTLMDFEPHLSNIAPYIVDLKLLGLSSEQCQSIFSHIHEGHFRKLQIINIEGYELFEHRIQDDAMMDWFISALYQIKDSITELSIHIKASETTTTSGQQQSPVPAETIIAMCENLTKFHYIQYNADLQTKAPSQEKPVNRPNLIDIKLGFKSIQQSTLDTINSCCRNLEHMNFYGCKIRNNFEFREQLPPNLISFSRNGLDYSRPSSSVYVTRDDDNNDSLNFSPTGPGSITTLNGYVGEFEDLEWVIDNDTLEELREFDIKIRAPTPPPSEVDPTSNPCVLFSTTFHNLQILSIYYNEHIRYNDLFIIDLLRRTPNLESLSIYDCDELGKEFVKMVRKQVAHSLTCMFMDCVFGAEDQQGIEKLFQDLATVSQQEKRQNGNSGMRRLILLNCGFNMDRVMESVAEMDTLEYLDMQCCEVSEGTMESYFETLVKRQSGIETLVMTCQDGITDKALQYINMLPKLKTISLWSQDGITKDGIQSLRNNPQVKKVLTRDCNHIEDDDGDK